MPVGASDITRQQLLGLFVTVFFCRIALVAVRHLADLNDQECSDLGRLRS
jgi:hypothetical protein